ncbi:eukaryotic translation initiation factor 5B [Anabrus simplex]|uniref:eukaryotic translation initiation factor 5B n=1 Tax=Anabrus simplex TaxID=316456 RepID=UPI0035A333B4
MGKAKKGKKGNKEDEIDDDLEVESQTVIDENVPAKGKEKKGKQKTVRDEDDGKGDVGDDDDEDDVSSKKKKGKKEKKKKKDDGSMEDVDEIEKGVEQLSIEKGKKDKKQAKKAARAAAESSDEEEVKRSAKASAGKKKSAFEALADKDDDGEDEEAFVKPNKSSNKMKKGGFALLAVEDDVGDSDSDGGKVIPMDSEDEGKTSKKASSKKTVVRSDSLEDDNEVNNSERTKEDKSIGGGKKGKKSKKKKQDEDDEDIEKMLAELEMEYSGVKKEEPTPEEKSKGGEDSAKTDSKKKSKKKGGKGDSIDILEEVREFRAEADGETVDDDETEGSTMKTAAQKKKEKKEREKQKKLEQKKKEAAKKTEVTSETTQAPAEVPEAEPAKTEAAEGPAEGEDEEGDDKKKKKKKKGAKEEETKTKGPGKKTLAAMKEALQKMKEEEERLKREEEERIRKIEEAERIREEQRRLEIERKEKKKQKEKERKERLKAEGKWLTAKQKADRARAQALLEARLAQGLELPTAGERKAPRPGTRIRPNKAKKQQTPADQENNVEQKVELEIVDQVPLSTEASLEHKKDEEEEEDVKDTWDADSSEGEEEEDKSEMSKGDAVPGQPSQQKGQEDEDDDEETSKEESDSEEESSEEESESEDEHKTDAERKRERALARIQKRREDAEKNRTLDVLRAAVVCVLGHVDTGKTKILDKLRRTNVQDGEAGGITQQIGATNVPIDAIKEQTKIVKGFAEVELKIPGLLIIDTPGHESFSNLRSRGSSLCDIAILVVDIMHGLEPQTIESINLLKSKKTPFIVALNKIDRLYDWQTMNRKDVRDIIKGQAPNTQLEFEQRTKETIVQFAEQGLNAALFYENPDIRSYVSLVPTSAITGEGMGNLLALIVESCQNMLAKRLMYSDELQATVLEVKAIPGLGTTIDAILVNGKLREGDTMVLAGTDGPIVTQIRSLLMPQPMKELRVKNAYVEYKEIMAAQGVKIAAKELEKAIAGLNLLVAQKPDEVDILREEVARDLRKALSNIKLQERGVYVQASTLGSLEALLEFLRTSKIPYANIRIGPVVKKDVMKASTMLEHDSQYATILAFDVKVERDAQELADTLGVKIFQADIIYHLFDKFMAYREELKQRKREEFKHIAVFPCKLKVLPQFIFNSRDPIVMGVMVEAGIVKEGTPICVPSRDFVDLGVVTSIESNHKNVESARKGQEVCIKIEPIPGEAPKMFGRHFDEQDFLISKISRQSIDACKDYFRDDLVKTDWQLMVELKKLFQIL